MEIYESLKRFRRHKNLTQDAVAKILGTSKQVYYRYEKDVIPSAEIIKKIAVTFNVSTDYLLGLTDIPTNNFNPEFLQAFEEFSKKIYHLTENQISE